VAYTALCIEIQSRIFLVLPLASSDSDIFPKLTLFFQSKKPLSVVKPDVAYKISWMPVKWVVTVDQRVQHLLLGTLVFYFLLGLLRDASIIIIILTIHSSAVFVLGKVNRTMLNLHQESQNVSTDEHKQKVLLLQYSSRTCIIQLQYWQYSK